MPDPLGQDFGLNPELSFRIKTGRNNLTDALLRRLTTPRGGLWYDPTYGTDIRQFLNETVSDGGYEMAVLIEAELEGDERVLSAVVTVLALNLNSLTFSAEIETATGPFLLVCTADQARGVILQNDVNGLAQTQIGI